MEQNEYMFGTLRLSTRLKANKGGKVTDFIAYLVKEEKDVDSSELFGAISEKILKELDKLEDENELLVQEDKILGKRQTEYMSPSGSEMKRSPQGTGFKKSAS
jgi:hypothetical protein